MAALDLEFLRAFLAIYREGSLTAAAQALHLSQPAVSQQLKALEARLGKPLFVRLPRGIAATPAGHDLARDVAPHLDALEAVAEAAGSGLTSVAGTVLLGGPADLLAARVVGALAPLVEQGITIRAVTGLAQPLLEEVRADRLDLVIATQLPARRGALVVERLFDETFVLVAGPRWAARIDRAALLADGERALGGVPLCAFAEDLPIVRRWFRTVLGVRVSAKAAVVIDDLRGVLAAVVAGAGVSVLPRYLVADALRRGEVVELATPPAPPKNTLYLAARAATLRQPRVAIVRGLLLRAAAGWD